ncbi:lasso peptide biosynthesis protein [Massilia sp. CT11-108]|uniref:lasso peptide biosynthesis protein n=1 Tax=Massilia sp. CT11-108 TaxID=3393900 RepID=UPI0039A5011F
MTLTEDNLDGVLSWGQSQLHLWLASAFTHRNECGKDGLAYRVFEVVLRDVWEKPYLGACHDTSAIMYIMLAELGQASELCVGQVKVPNGPYLDHSWVEVDGKVIDAAISLPRIDGGLCSFPVFGSIDLGYNNQMELDYAYDDGKGFTDFALAVYGVPLGEFTRLPGGNEHLWEITANLLIELGISVRASSLATKYSDHLRSVRIQTPERPL